MVMFENGGCFVVLCVYARARAHVYVCMCMRVCLRWGIIKLQETKKN